MPFSAWPAPARAIATGLEEAVAAARVQERSRFEEAIAEVAALDESRVAVVFGSVVQMLLEETQPDGLSGPDVQELLDGCLRATLPWYPAVDVDLLLVVVGGALGMQDPGTEPVSATPAAVTAHACLLVAELLRITGRPPAAYLEVALSEIARAETIEMP